MSVNKLILGDNLETLKTLESESVDLIYLDTAVYGVYNLTDEEIRVVEGGNG
jgi:DNA modification methylase